MRALTVALMGKNAERVLEQAFLEPEKPVVDGKLVISKGIRCARRSTDAETARGVKKTTRRALSTCP